MSHSKRIVTGATVSCALAIASLLYGSVADAQPTLSVIGVDSQGAQTPLAASEYRWLVEEDRTFHVTPGFLDPSPLSVNFHASYMPVVGKGPGSVSLPATMDPAKHYFVSVTPTASDSYAIGGAAVSPGASSVTVYLQKLPLPTAQITVFAFEDTTPTNGAVDLGEEGIGGLQVSIEDAGGRYGQSGGQQLADAFGNPLGTEYEYCTGVGVPDASCTAAGQPVLQGGAPVPTGVVTPLVTGACPGPTCGELTIKNVMPGKYGVRVIPDAGSGWQQTSTIEGTKVTDAWVKANEPPFFAEFGPPGYHAFVGFVKENLGPIPNPQNLGLRTITGTITNLHLSKPPDYAFYSSAAAVHTIPWIVLNDNAGTPGASNAVYITRANPDGSFAVGNVPIGDYQLVVFDEYLDFIIATQLVRVNDSGCASDNGTCDFGEIPVFQWFTRQEHVVFFDSNRNGKLDAGERGIPDQNINIRWRDGTIYQSYPTDLTGFVPFDQVFPFFAWQVAEVDFARFEATGVTVTVDDGGPTDPDDPYSFGGQLNPQPQDPAECDPSEVDTSGNCYSRTETGKQGEILLEGFQGFIGQTTQFQWGKAPYALGTNGGITGIVFYATTRAENDPRLAAAENWEPGVPGVTVNLYQYDPSQPLGRGSLVNSAQTDSWDDNQPTGCRGPVYSFDPDGPTGPASPNPRDCFDGLRVFNQARPAVFDGGYAFFTDFYDNPLPAGQYIVQVIPPPGYEIVKEEDKNVDFGQTVIPQPQLLPPVCTGDRSELGYPANVPAYLTLFPDQQIDTYRAGQATPLCNAKLVQLNDRQNAAADFFLFTETPVASHIYGFILDDTQNEFDPSAPNFGEKYAPPWMPVSIRDWTGREITRTYSDQYGVYNALVPSTYTANVPAPSGMSPNMLTACMNDGYFPDGTPDPHHNPKYSTFCYTLQYMPGTTTYLDTPTIPLAAYVGPGKSVDCEFENRTPRIKQASVGSSGPYISRLDADKSNAAPAAQLRLAISSEGATQILNPEYLSSGNYSISGNTAPRTITRDYGFGTVAGTVTLEIPGAATAGNPDPTPTTMNLPIDSWSDSSITVRIPREAARTGCSLPFGAGNNCPTPSNNSNRRAPYGAQIHVTRGDNGKRSLTGVTVQVGLRRCTMNNATGTNNLTACELANAPRHVTPGATIQSYIDTAQPNDLLLVDPGNYNELVVMWKPLQLQGWGSGATKLTALNTPANKLQDWRLKVQSLVEGNLVQLLPAQEIEFGGIEPATLFTEEGAGILVLGNLAAPTTVAANQNARIDGFTITGASNGGGIVLNGYANRLQVTNNRIIQNDGFFGGGIRVGHPTMIDPVSGQVQDSFNDFVRIKYNHITQNGGGGGAGGGVSICRGADAYAITENFICGNFTLGGGAGVGQQGLSTNGLIARNKIVFNESFEQTQTTNGGGILISGSPAVGGQALSQGSGSVRIDRNLILGNSAGSGDGGGIALLNVNGQDITPLNQTAGGVFTVDITNNMIVDNVAALAAGGISLQETTRARIIHNTIAWNDSTATAGAAFTPGNPNDSQAQPAGVVARAHSAALLAALGSPPSNSNPGTGFRRRFPNPLLDNNIIWHNRSFSFHVDPTAAVPYSLIQAAGYPDLSVLGGFGCLNPRASFLSTLVRPANCTAGNYAAWTTSATNTGNLADPTSPQFLDDAPQNQAPTPTITFPGVTTALQAVPAFDEGGNFIRVRFEPIRLTDPVTDLALRDFHLSNTSPARTAANVLLGPGSGLSQLLVDFDGQSRPAPLISTRPYPDMGADENPN